MKSESELAVTGGDKPGDGSELKQDKGFKEGDESTFTLKENQQPELLLQAEYDSGDRQRSVINAQFLT